MVLTSTIILTIEHSPQNRCQQCLRSQSEFWLLPASPGDSPRSVNGSYPGPFQITISALHLRMCEIVCVPFKSSLYFP